MKLNMPLKDTVTENEINVLCSYKNNISYSVLIPKGTIVLWTKQNIPFGWALCDGSNKTPNLIDKFIKGGNLTGYGSPSATQTGGAKTFYLNVEQLPSHSHEIYCKIASNGIHKHTGTTSSDGSHTHIYNYKDNQGLIERPDGGNDHDNIFMRNDARNNLRTEESGSHIHDFKTSTNGIHNHTCSNTISNTGNGSEIDNQPQFYVLSYIIKI